MFNYNSESDESLENMKLDLIKAKYAHQKLKNNYSDISKNPLNTPKGIYQRNSKNNFSNISKPTKDFSIPKSSESPTSSRKSQVNDHVSIGSKSVLSYDDSDEDLDDEEDGNISKMNEYVDYLLNKKRISLNEGLLADFNLPITGTYRGITPTMDISNSHEAYHRSSHDCNPVNNAQPTDILAQWRLRRKMNEAQSSVRTEHQIHNLQINSLKSQISNDRQSYSSHPHIYLQDSFNAAVSDKTVKSIERDCDQVPVRDVINNNRPIFTTVNTTAVNLTPRMSSVSCQCQLDKHYELHKDVSSKTEHKFKPSRNSKHKKCVGVMTSTTDTKISKPIDCGTQTDGKHSAVSIQDDIVTSRESDNVSVCPDYIDRAIEKTLQSQLFERNYSPSLSTVTSINESQHIDVAVQRNSQIISIEDNNKDANSIDANCEELPWNEQFQIESDGEFMQDDVLIDLRRRRNLNLQKLRNLSKEIQNYQTRYLASIESC